MQVFWSCKPEVLKIRFWRVPQSIQKTSLERYVWNAFKLILARKSKTHPRGREFTYSVWQLGNKAKIYVFWGSS